MDRAVAKLIGAGLFPAGSRRATRCLEGLNLYGQDMDEHTIR
jgi:hypothetical protein